MPYMLFTDGSVNPKTRRGVGAYLCLSTEDFENLALPKKSLHREIATRVFADTSSTLLELQTVLWALQEVVVFDARETKKSSGVEVVLFTDCQNIVQLPNRRSRLETNNYLSRKNIPLNNAELYRDFFQFLDNHSITIVKVKGHSKQNLKTKAEKIFTLVDRESRACMKKS